MDLLYYFDQKKYKHLLENENEQDDLEDKLSGFLVKLQISLCLSAQFGAG